MTNSLLDRIDAELVSQVHRVLIRAAENVGECSYSLHLPGYRRASKELQEFRRGWFKMDSYRNQQAEWRIMSALQHHHRAMYQQPCLLCEDCQSRVKFWHDSAYSMFGERRDASVDNLYYDSPIANPIRPPYFCHL